MSAPRRPRREEREALISLWCRVFGDPEELAERFTRLYPPEENALVIAGEEGPDSALWDVAFGRLSTGEPLRMGYAFATRPEARGRGNMTALLRALPLCARFYIPADPGLMNWYCSLGAAPFFRCDRGEYRSGGAAPVPMEGIGREEYFLLREALLADRVHDLPDGRALDWQDAIFARCGGGYFGGDGCGALLGYDEEGVPFVTELLSPAPLREGVLEGLLRLTGGSSIRWIAPAEGAGLPYGVLHPGSPPLTNRGPAPWIGYSFA